MSASPHVKRVTRACGLLAVPLVTALFVWYLIHSLRGQDLGVYATPRAAIGIVLAALCWSCTVPLLALAWRNMLCGLGIFRSRRELYAVLGLTQFAKYVPGHVAQYLGRAGMSMARGIPAPALAGTIVLETLLLVIAGIAVGVGTGLMSSIGMQAVRRHAWQLVLVVAVVALAAAGLCVLRRLAPLLLQRFAPRYASALHGAWIPRQHTLARAFLLYCCMQLVLGLGLILLVQFMLPSAQNDYWLLIAAFSLAWVIGFVTPGAPGGLGVREALLMLMLVPMYGSAASGILVVASRIATTLGDAGNFGVGWFLLPKNTSKSEGREAAPEG